MVETMLPLENAVILVKCLTGLISRAHRMIQSFSSQLEQCVLNHQFFSFILLARFGPNTPFFDFKSKFYTRPTVSKNAPALLFTDSVVMNMNSYGVKCRGGYEPLQLRATL